MSWQLDPDGDPTPIYVPDDTEDRLDRVIRRSERVLRDHEQMKADIEWARKPYWVKLEEEGDYSPWDAGMYPEESDE